MGLLKDEFKDIPESQIGYFGGPGRMLLPSDATVAALIGEVPQMELITTDLLRKVLAERFKVQGTCPVTTRKALQAIAADASQPVAFWRVIKQNGELIDKFPGGVEGQAAHLREEGFTIDRSGKKPKVARFKASLVKLR
jgi:hypothetical protein